MAVDLEGEDLLGVRLALLGRVGELDAAGLHAAAGQHLRLDHDRAADVGRDLLGALGVRGEAAAGDGDALALEDLPALVLEEPHRGAGTLAGAAVRAYGGFEVHLAPTRPPVDACRRARWHRPLARRAGAGHRRREEAARLEQRRAAPHVAGAAPDRRPLPRRAHVRDHDGGADDLRHHRPRAARAGRGAARCRTSRTRTSTSAATSCWSRTTRARASASCT